MKILSRTAVHMAVVAALSCPVAALAQQESPPAVVGLEEVVITAQKRQQSLQEVPLSVSAFSEEMLQAGRMADRQVALEQDPIETGQDPRDAVGMLHDEAVHGVGLRLTVVVRSTIMPGPRRGRSRRQPHDAGTLWLRLRRARV